MDIYRVIFYISMVPISIMLLIPKLAKYGLLLVGLSFIPFGMSIMVHDRDMVLAVGPFAIAAVAVGRFIANRVRRA